ncbi:MAG TPA: hypothetical protein VGR29_09695, partial [Thermomicrobiales bacterium]|nr:hypothetical protein [Thermomicrobiales bacterium]
VYRIAMERRGYALGPTAFARSYTIAARYTGLRYLWWTLTAWLEDQMMDEWVMHYVNMILR